MTIRDRTYVLRWGLLILGIIGWELAATGVDAALSRPAPSGNIQAAMPDRPRPLLVVPVDTLPPGAPADLSAQLALPMDSLAFVTQSGTDTLRTGTDTAQRFGGAKAATNTMSGETAQATASPIADSADGRASPRAASALQRSPAETTVDMIASPSPDVVTASSVPASPPASPAAPRTASELGGLVIDETMTPYGRTFYADFFRVWRSPAVEGFYTVRVQEKPTPGRGTLVQVFVNDDVVFRARLQPQTDIAEQALQAARRTYGYVRSGRGILRIY